MTFKDTYNYAKETSKSLQCNLRIQKDGMRKWSVIYFHTARFEMNLESAANPKNLTIQISPKFNQQAIARQNSKKI